MKYNILWFEDKEDYIETHEPTLRNYLKGFGFELVVVPREDDGNLEEVLTSSQPDLILMDYRLSKYNDDGEDDADNGTPLTGDTIITRIRNCNLDVETVLYSRDPLFPTNVTERLEGVWFATHTELPEKAKKVISLTIKKQQEISNIRGLFIAEAIDIATEIEELIIKILNLQAPARVDLFRSHIMYSEFFSDFEKYNFIQRILKEKQKILREIGNGKYTKAEKKQATDLLEILDPLITKYSKMENEVIVQRNQLAHSKPAPDNSGLIYKGKIVKLDETKCKNIRADFQAHTENIRKIAENIERVLEAKYPEKTPIKK